MEFNSFSVILKEVRILTSDMIEDWSVFFLPAATSCPAQFTYPLLATYSVPCSELEAADVEEDTAFALMCFTEQGNVLTYHARRNSMDHHFICRKCFDLPSNSNLKNPECYIALSPLFYR